MARVGASVHVGTAVRAAVRPERVALGPSSAPVHPDGSVVFGTVQEVIYLGAVSLFHLDIPGLGQLVSQRMSHEQESAFQTGDPVSASWEPAHTLVLEANPE
ncbi:MAG: TOBE domain-containing protein [bacterium]|nr:TOBE domain-containing protein [bacterium]